MLVSTDPIPKRVCKEEYTCSEWNYKMKIPTLGKRYLIMGSEFVSFPQRTVNKPVYFTHPDICLHPILSCLWSISSPDQKFSQMATSKESIHIFTFGHFLYNIDEQVHSSQLRSLGRLSKKKKKKRYNCPDLYPLALMSLFELNPCNLSSKDTAVTKKSEVKEKKSNC